MRNVMFFLLLTSFFSFAEKSTFWIEAIPPNFNNLERLFTQSNCKAVLGVSYIYNTKTGHWLPSEQANALFPNAKLHLSLQPPRKEEKGKCSINTSKQELKQIFGVNLKNSNEHVLLFLDAFYNIQGKRNSFHPDFDQKMKRRYLELTAFNALPKYHIKVNSLGLKSQKM